MCVLLLQAPGLPFVLDFVACRPSHIPASLCHVVRWFSRRLLACRLFAAALADNSDLATSQLLLIFCLRGSAFMLSCTLAHSFTPQRRSPCRTHAVPVFMYDVALQPPCQGRCARLAVATGTGKPVARCPVRVQTRVHGRAASWCAPSYRPSSRPAKCCSCLR